MHARGGAKVLMERRKVKSSKVKKKKIYTTFHLVLGYNG